MFGRKGVKPSTRVQYAEVEGNTKLARQKNWAPLAVRTPFLVGFAWILLLCVIALELLVRQTEPYTPPAAQQDVVKRAVEITAPTVPTPLEQVSRAQAHVSLSPSTRKYYQKSRSSARRELKRFTSSRTPPSIKSQTSEYLDVGVATTPIRTTTPVTTPAAAAPTPTTTPITIITTVLPNSPPTLTSGGMQVTVTNTLLSKPNAYVDLGSTTSPTAKASTIASTTANEVNIAVSGISSYPNLGGPTTSSAKGPTTTPAVVQNTGTITKTSGYLDLGSSTTPAAKASTTTPANVEQTSYVSNTSGYLDLGSSTTPAAKVTPTTTTPPAIIVSSTKTQPGGYLSLDGATTPTAQKTTTPATTSPRADAVTSTTDPMLKGPTTTRAAVGDTTVTAITKTSEYLNLDQSTSAAQMASSTTPTILGDTKSYAPTKTSGYLNLDSSTTSMAGIRYLSSTGVSFISKTSEYLDLSSPTSSAGTSGKAGTTSPITGVPTYTSDGYLEIGSTTRRTSDSLLVSSATSGNYLKLDSSTTRIATVISGSTLYTDGPISSHSMLSATDMTSSKIRSTDGVMSVDSEGTSTGSLTGGTTESSLAMIATRKVVTTNSQGSSITIDVITTLTSKRIITTNSQGSTITLAAVVSTQKVVTTNSQGSTITSDVLTTSTSTVVTATATGLSAALTHLMKPDMKVKGVFEKWWYFVAMYLPSILAVILRETWFIIVSGLKMMEPFYQLGKPEGANARDSVMADYLSSTISPYSLSSAFHGNLTMGVILVGNLIMYLLAPLAAESMTVVALNIYVNEFGDTLRNTPAWMLRLSLIRTLQGIMSFVVLLLAILIYVRRHRRSGLSANPSQIATMGTLLNHEGMIQSLNTLDSRASNDELARTIAHENYMITNHIDRYGNTTCGIVKVGDIVPHGVHQIAQDDHTHRPSFVQFDRVGHHRGVRPIEERVLEIIFVVVVFCLLGTLIAYWLDGSDSAFNTFFNSGTFGPKFILSTGASICVATFGSFEREVRLLTPYRRLAEGQAPARHSVLRSVDGTAVSSLFRSARHGNWLHFWIALVTIFGNLLIIAVTGVPFGDNVTWIGLLVCLSLSVGITSLMLLTTFAVFKWRHTNKKLEIPYLPNDTLLHVWMSMGNKDNQLRTAVNDADGNSAKAVKARLTEEGALYCAKWVRDDDGRASWRVDKEPHRKQAQYAD